MARNGIVGDVVDSCNGERACYELAYLGIVGDIVNSCNGDGEEFL